MPSRALLNARRLSVGVAGLVAAAACTGGGGAAPAGRAVVATTTPEAVRSDDGVLTIGLLAPRSGDGAALGQSLTDATRLAVERINAAGGFRGEQVVLVEADEGSTAAEAREAIESLLDEDVDAVIGPTSSTIAVATLGDLLAGGVVTCSPTATALALDDYPDSELFFRTAPSDSLQATAIAQVVERTGVRTAAVAYLDDTYGRPLAQATVTALESTDVAVTAEIPFTPSDESLLDEAAQLGDEAVGVVIVIGDADQGMRLLTAMGETSGRFSGASEPPDIVVNDALRRPASAQLVEALPQDVRDSVVGVSPLAMGQQAEEPPGPFATNAFDCVNLIALAAEVANSDGPAAVAGHIVEVSQAGVECHDHATCLDLLREDRNIDYEGPGGVVQIGTDGDPLRARFEVFAFDDAGIDVPERSLVISA